METSPDVEFDFYLTERLGWRSVAAMRRGLKNAEYEMWSMYYQRYAQRREQQRLMSGG